MYPCRARDAEIGGAQPPVTEPETEPSAIDAGGEEIGCPKPGALVGLARRCVTGAAVSGRWRRHVRSFLPGIAQRCNARPSFRAVTPILTVARPENGRESVVQRSCATCEAHRCSENEALSCEATYCT